MHRFERIDERDLREKLNRWVDGFGRIVCRIKKWMWIIEKWSTIL